MTKHGAALRRRQVLQGTGTAAGVAILAACGGAIPAATPLPVAAPAGSASAPAATPATATAAATATSPPRPATVAPPVLSPAQAPAAATGAVRYQWQDVGNPTPFQISVAGPGGAVLLSLLYDTLTWKDATGIIPWLASRWEASADGLVYTFSLVGNAAWHDGVPLTAEDVRFSFDYYAKFPYRWMGTEVVQSARATDARTVAITLKRPYAAFLEDIAGIVPVIPRHIWEPVADPVQYTGAGASVGSGPFRFVARNEAEGTYRLAANPAYWRGTARVAEWQQLAIPAAAQIETARQGGVDLVSGTDASVRGLLAGDPRLRVFESAPLSIVRLAVNTRRVPLDRREVRQAIMAALDRARIAETITRGAPITGGTGVVPPETPWFNPALPASTYDPAKARSLLGGTPVAVDLIADSAAREPDLMQPMLAAAGITVNVRRADAATRTKLQADGNFQLALTAHIGVGGDPDYLRRWYSGEEANAFAQGSIFDNAEYTRLGNAQAATLDPAQRKPLVLRMQEILADELPTIVLYHRRFYWVHDPARFTPMNTWGGLMNGIPLPVNKLTLLGG